MPNENLWWYDPIQRGARRGWDIVSGWGERAGEAITGLGETEEERRRRLQARSDAAARESYFKQYPHQQDVSQEQIFKDKWMHMRGQDPNISIVPGVGAVQVSPKKEKDEESEFDKYMKMKFISEIIKRPEAPSPGYATRAGTARSPVAASIMQTYPQRRQDDILNFRYGPSYGRMV
jgi:hypothetical protein